MKEIYLAGGCFWGIQAYFDNINGVVNTVVGYANGITENPTYEKVCKGDTKHAETLCIQYNEKIIDLYKILDYYWKVIDPTSLNKQGEDKGNQYRTGIYFNNIIDLNTIKISLENIQKKHKNKVVTEICELLCFYPAEEYHQKYLEKNPNGYCHIDLNL